MRIKIKQVKMHAVKMDVRVSKLIVRMLCSHVFVVGVLMLVVKWQEGTA